MSYKSVLEADYEMPSELPSFERKVGVILFPEINGALTKVDTVNLCGPVGNPETGLQKHEAQSIHC